MQRKDLVVLEYGKNVLMLNVKRIDKIDGLELNLEDKTWSWGEWGGVRIGQSRIISRNHQYGVVGVYDSTRVVHLDNMVCNALSTEHIKPVPISDY
jgi:hypothetical protein